MNDDLDTLARQLPDPARHDLPGHRHQLLRERFMDQISADRVGESAAQPVPAPPGRMVRHRRILVTVTAGVTAVVMALWMVSAATLGVGRFWSGQTEAGELLERIALVAGSSTDIPPADQIRDDQYIYVETYGGHGGVVLTFDDEGQPIGDGWELVPLEMHTRQIWLSVDGSRPGLLRDTGRPRDGEVVLEPHGEVYLNGPTLRYLTTLPTNPDLLLAKIYLETWGAGPNPQQEAFVTIGDLMRESVVPPRLAAALYRAAARIPGTEVVDDAVDALGRHGVAIARTHDGLRTEWIFDRGTLQFLGERTVTTETPGSFVPPGIVTASTAVVARAIVDRPGQLPG
ncbi:MAG TPA: CU044_5270 family protein [Micromonosporaceae bacterium]|nr:CU044_5270 family protein [Micromonosporaceae bacterium]